MTNYSGIEIVAMKRGDSIHHLAIQVLEAKVAEGVKFDAIYTQNDSRDAAGS
jgi:hypothetical protein